MSFIISVLKSKDLRTIRLKLAALYLLNVTDVIFTLLLIKTGMFTEANFIMKYAVINKPWLAMAIKAVVPAILFIWIIYRIKNATDKQLLQSSILINCCLTFYETYKYIPCRLVHIVCYNDQLK